MKFEQPDNLNPSEKIEEEAGCEVVKDYTDEFELTLLQNIVEAEKNDKNISKEQTEKLEKDFDEYMKLKHDLISEHKGNFSQKMIDERIFDNSWVKLMKKIFGLAHKEPVSSDTIEESPKEDSLTLKDRANFKKDVAKKLAKKDFH